MHYCPPSHSAPDTLAFWPSLAGPLHLLSPPPVCPAAVCMAQSLTFWSLLQCYLLKRPPLTWLSWPCPVVLISLYFFLFLHSAYVCVCAQSLICVWLFATPWTVAHQAPLFMEFSRQEQWSGLPFPTPGDLPDPGIKPSLASPALALYHCPIWETISAYYSPINIYFMYLFVMSLNNNVSSLKSRDFSNLLCLSIFPLVPRTEPGTEWSAHEYLLHE